MEIRNKYLENTYLIKENYKNWFTPSTELGRWLQTKNIVEIIGNYLFVHGGISPEINQSNMNIEKINSLARKFYFNENEIKENQSVYLLFDSETSPFWYRGIANEDINQEEFDEILSIFNVNKIIIGHTITDNVKYLYNKKVINIDTKHSEGNTQGLLIENGYEYRIDINGKKTEIK